MATSQDSLGTLFSELSTQIGDLIRQQSEIARLEISAAVRRVEHLAISAALGAGLAIGGGLALIAASVLALVAVGLPPWAAAGLVGIVLAATGYVMAQQAIARLNRDELTPKVTVQTIKENAEWVKHPTKT